MRQIIWETQFLEFKNNGRLGYSEEDEDIDDDFLEDLEIDRVEEVQNLMSTPFGVFSINNKLNPYYNYKFFIGHTNFNITKSVSSLIEAVPGVEVFSVISRYRFIIAIGKAFDQAIVRKNITDMFCEKNEIDEKILSKINKIEDDEYREYIIGVLSEVDYHYDKWVLFTTSDPELNCDFIGYKEGDDMELYKKDVAKFKRKHSKLGLILEK